VNGRSSSGQGLLANIVSGARQQAPLPLHVACGLGGGGEALVRALWDAAGVEMAGVSREIQGADSGDPMETCHRAGHGTIIDRVRCPGIGPSLPNDGHGSGEGWCIVLTRDCAESAMSLASFAGPDAAESLFCELLCQVCSVPAGNAAALAADLGFPMALIWDLREMREDWRDASVSELYRACLAAPTVTALRRQMTERDGRALLDLGRVVCLMDPSEIQLSDEWALLAKALSGRRYSVADISLVLDAYPGLFEVSHGARHTVARPSSRLASVLLLGGVAPSSSEHFVIYRALRDRSQAALERPDESDGFVAKHLPRQAAAAAALPELTSDPLGVLCSDPFALLRELEAQPRQLRRPAGKVIALSAHRLLDGPDQASQLELSARRIGLYRFADTLASALPNRRWRPLWAQAELAHTHRVALNHRAPLLSVAAVENEEGMAFVGSADGEVWRISPYRHPVRLDGSKSLEGEIRAIAASKVDDRELVAVGTSTHAVGVLDGRRGNLKWLDNDAHKDPLSAATIHIGDRGTLLTAGVGGLIYAHPLLDGEQGQIVYEHGSEIRGLQAVRVDATDLIVFCAVDGVVGIVRLADGSQVARWHMAEEVLNSVAARLEGRQLRLVAGTSKGSLRQLRLPVEWLAAGDGADLRSEAWDVLAQHPLAVNSVRIVGKGDDDFAVVSGASDGSWQWNDREGTQQVGLGHVGPIWSVDFLSAGDRRYVVTAGGEGACRLWLTEAVLDEKITHAQPLAHRGPVSAIELAVDPAEKVLVLTGGSDGDVRVGAPSLAQGGELLTRHDSDVSALISVTIDDVRSHVVSGSVDGALRLTPIGARRQRESTVLGIAHEGVMALSSGALGTQHEVVSGGRDGTITSWNLDTRTPNMTVQGCRYGSVQALCHIEGHGEGMLVVGGQDGGLSVFHGPMLEKRGDPSMLDASILCLCPLPSSPSGLLAGLADGRVGVVRELGLYGESISYIEASENEIRGLGTLILGGRVFMACAGLDRHLRLLDIQAGEEAIDIELDGYALSLKAIGAAVGLGTSAGAAVISYPTDILVLNP
jgi:WD40 repeat protein